MKLIILITAHDELGLEIAEAWQRAGAPGVTIIRSHGLHTLQQLAKSGDIELPRMVASLTAAMAHIIDGMEKRGHLLISGVEDDQVDDLITAAESVLGDMTTPDNGVVFVLPIERAIGVVQRNLKQS